MNKLTIRNATLEDCDDLFLWRNDPLSVEMSSNQSTVSQKEHQSWIKEILLKKDKVIYIGINEQKEKIGMVGFDLQPQVNEATISINLNPIFRGQKLAYILLDLSIQAFLQSRKLKISAQIKKTNSPSIAIFKKCGFQLHKEDRYFFYLLKV